MGVEKQITKGAAGVPILPEKQVLILNCEEKPLVPSWLNDGKLTISVLTFD